MKHVCILNGVHRGAVVGIGEDPILIGGDDDCDALLSDVSVAGSAIRVSMKPDGKLMATSIRGTATRNGRRIRADRNVAFPAGTVIGLGDVTLAVGDDVSIVEQSVSHRDNQHMMFKWGGLAVACLAVFALFGVVGGPADAYNSQQGVRTSAPASMALRVAGRDPIPELEGRISDAGFSGAIVITRDETSKIVATGSIVEEERGRWRDIVQWFDGRFGDIAILESRVSGRNDDIVLPFQIVSIRTAPNPQIAIQNGQVYPLGSILPGGWEVRRIESMTVMIANEDRELVISF